MLWNDAIKWGQRGHRNVDDVGFIAKLMDDLIKRSSVDATRIYVIGISKAVKCQTGSQLSSQTELRRSVRWAQQLMRPIPRLTRRPDRCR